MKKNDAAGERRCSPRRTAEHPQRSATAAEPADRPESQRAFRYWVEIRDLRDGSVRTLPLHAIRLVHLGRKRSDPAQPDEHLLRLQDDTTIIEVKDLDELASRLRQRYPDETHERRLHWERDLEVEQRRAAARESLIQLLAEAVVNDLLREQTAGPNESGTT
jgi:hypothetical protein